MDEVDDYVKNCKASNNLDTSVDVEAKAACCLTLNRAGVLFVFVIFLLIGPCLENVSQVEAKNKIDAQVGCRVVFNGLHALVEGWSV